MDLFCKKLPKIELHAHLNGSLSKSTLLDLGGCNSFINKYQNNLLQKDNRTLDECFELFQIAHNLTNNVTAVYKATSSVIEDFYKDNCIYLEIRTTPRREIGMTKKDYIEAVIKAIIDNKFDIIVKLILSIDRAHSYDESQNSLELIINMKNKYPNIVVGVDLCGNPTKGNFYSDIFTKAREHGLFITLHCAEVKNDEETTKILEFMPDRLGHATFLRSDDNETCWEKYKKNPIPVECCLTSNVRCGTVKEFEKHHVKYWIKHKLPFCLSTDDKGVFNTTLSEEYFLAHKYFLYNSEELLNITVAAVNHCFCSLKEKEIIFKKLDYWKEQSFKEIM